MTTPAYRGRFAPSPTGPLHFGSLVAAVASYADARRHNGEWLVRIEDVDETRRKPEAEAQILKSLQTFGMHWDAPPVRQSERKALYQAALDRLVAKQAAFRCNCSRKTLADLGRIGPEGPIYPGTCLKTPPPDDAQVAWRVRVPDEPIGFADRILGHVEQNLADELGDFIVRRVDQYTAYQLAVVVDDFDQGITHVVRGADLLWSTPRQIWLQRLLEYPTPGYAHIPLVFGDDGNKLSKRDNAHPVRENAPIESLRAAWAHLGQVIPPDLRSVDAFWEWAADQWRIERIPKHRNPGHERTDTL